MTNAVTAQTGASNTPSLTETAPVPSIGRCRAAPRPGVVLGTHRPNRTASMILFVLDTGSIA